MHATLRLTPQGLEIHTASATTTIPKIHAIHLMDDHAGRFLTWSPTPTDIPEALQAVLANHYDLKKADHAALVLPPGETVTLPELHARMIRTGLKTNANHPLVSLRAALHRDSRFEQVSRTTWRLATPPNPTSPAAGASQADG